MIDNDPQQSALPVCRAMKDDCGLPIAYAVERKRGISQVRNRAIATASPDSQFLVFIDDDEIPEPQWLDQLLMVQKNYNADVVAGPVESKLPHDAPTWATRGQIFRHYRYRTGEKIPFSATNNVLVRRSIFTEMPYWFDESFALSGGEDRHFFMRVSRSGACMVWADRAMVWEEVPASRTTIRWVIRRSYHQGSANAFCDLDVLEGRLVPLRVAAEALFWVGAGIVLLPWGMVSGSHRLVLYLRCISQGLGMFSGLLGNRHDEYRMIHGR